MIKKEYQKMIPVIVFTVIIFIISSLELKTIPGIPGIPKFSWNPYLHMGEFGLFSMLLMFGFPKIKPYILGLISITYGILDEIHQFFVPTRYFDVKDILFDVIGAILGIVLYLIVFYLNKTRKLKKVIFPF